MRFLSLLAALWMLQSCAASTPLQQRCAEGRRHLDDRQWDRAERSFDRALKLSPGYGPALVGRSSARIGLNRYPEALADLDAALKASPDRLEWRSRRGILLHAMGRYQEALVELDRVLARSPGHVASVTGRAMTYFRLKRCPEALREFSRARRMGVPIPDSWMRSCTAGVVSEPGQPGTGPGKPGTGPLK